MSLILRNSEGRIYVEIIIMDNIESSEGSLDIPLDNIIIPSDHFTPLIQYYTKLGAKRFSENFKTWMFINGINLHRIDFIIKTLMLKCYQTNTIKTPNRIYKLFDEKHILSQTITTNTTYDKREINIPINKYYGLVKYVIDSELNIPKYTLPNPTMMRHKYHSSSTSETESEIYQSTEETDEPSTSHSKKGTSYDRSPDKTSNMPKRPKLSLKACQKALIIECSQMTATLFDNCAYKVNIPTCGVLIYIEGYSLKFLADITGGMDISNYKISKGGHGRYLASAIRNHLIKYGTDIFYVNDFVIFRDMAAIYKIIININGNKSNILDTTVAENTADVIYTITSGKMVNIINIVTIAINDYIGNKASVTIREGLNNIEYSLVSLIPLHILKAWSDLKNRNKFV